jgi:hypothetical protein
MSTTTILLIVVIVALLAVIAGLGAAMASRRKKLQERFGPEYDRLVEQSQSRRLAEAEMTERERRVKKLDLRDLSESARQQYLAQWAGVQERFVDDPAAAIADGQRLVEAVMRDRGYPVAEYNQTIADLSVEHAQQLDHVRQAHEISEKAVAGQASTEELRVAMLHYRELFGELLAGPTTDSAATAGTTEVDTTDPDAEAAEIDAAGTVNERQMRVNDFDDADTAYAVPNGTPVTRSVPETEPDPIQVPHDDVVMIPDDEDDPARGDEPEEVEAGTGRKWGRR